MLILLSLVISVGFFTLLERKILGLTQLRLGPNKILIWGILQPVLDGLKLFKKFKVKNMKLLNVLYKFMSSFMFLISLLLWMSMPYFTWNSKTFFFMFILFILSLTSFCILMVGWSSFNNYGFLGSIRSVSQILSFEVNFGIFLFLVFFLMNKSVVALKTSISFMFWLGIIYWLLMMLETQRAPMDLSESESELVSGFNTEYSSLYFTMIFLAEYLNLLFFSGMFLVMLFSLNVIFWFILLSYVLLMRSCFPRIRFDLLLLMSWLKFMPILILLIFLMYPMKFL